MQAALAPRCRSRPARVAAYDLLRAIVTRSDGLMVACLRKLLTMLGPGPVVPDVVPQQFAQHHDANAAINLRWRGLNTTGATCYMNAVIQQLFCQPTIRALVLRSGEVPEGAMGEEKEAVFAAMQLTFANLALSTARAFRPSLMWNSVRDEMGQPINIHVRGRYHAFEQECLDLLCAAQLHGRCRYLRSNAQLCSSKHLAIVST
jgi:Ubiquitin carboxyl-terminal hydrolase